jgi:hypothetical protein
MNRSTLSNQQERQWSALAHASILLNMVTFVLGTVAVGVLYLVMRRRSSYVAFHALQSLVYQLIVWVGGWAVSLAGWILINALPDTMFTLFLMPIGFLINMIPMVGVVGGGLGAMSIGRGQEFSYPRIGEWALGVINR